MFLGGAGDEVGQHVVVAGDENDAAFAIDDPLGFEDFEDGFGHGMVLRDLAEGFADDLRANGAGLGEFDGGGALGGAGDDADLIGAFLPDGRGDLAQAVHDFTFNLFDHFVIAEVHLADVNRAEPVTPLVGLR